VSDGELRYVGTLMIHQAMKYVEDLYNVRIVNPMEVIVEDARNRGGSGVRAQGAGSIKRDCSIWEDFLTDKKIPFRFIRAGKSSITKATPEWVKLQTGWSERTSNHSRDAICLLLPFINNNRSRNVDIKQK
jgi:hypothetical protein